MTRPPRAREVWRAQIDDKRRPCVILRVEEDYVELLYGQGKPEPTGRVPHVDVLLGTHLAKRFRIDKDTYFRGTNVRVVHRSLLLEPLGTCTMLDFPRFERMAEFYYSQKSKQQPLAVVQTAQIADSNARLTTGENPE
jgi:hypothetical protein